jgi:hypothetical protein
MRATSNWELGLPSDDYLLTMRTIAALIAAQLVAWSAFAQDTLTDQNGRFNDEPSMVRAADGSLYIAWNGFRDNNDVLMLARYEYVNGTFQRRGLWQALGGAGTYLLNPKLVAAGERVYAVYAAEKGRNWDIYALRCGPDGPERPIPIDSDQATDVKPDAVWRDGTLWVTWESNRSNARGIYLRSLRDNRVSGLEVVTTAGGSNYSPSIAAGPIGLVSIVWHTFRNLNYDIWMRQRDSRGQWGAERRLTTAPSLDRNPVLLQNFSDLWLFYENSQMRGYRTGHAYQRRIITARIRPKGLEAPLDYRQSPLYGRTENPSAAFDADGRLWIAYLRPRLPRGGWEIWLTAFNGQTWEEPRQVSRLKGMDRKPAMVLMGGQALLAFQTDNFPETWVHNPKVTDQAKSVIRLAALDLRTARPVGTMRLEKLSEPDESFEAGPLHVEYGEDTPTLAVRYQGKNYKLFYGDLHAHSDISVCARVEDQSVDENYQVRRDINRLDFVGISDHDYNIVPYLWNYTAKIARANEDPSRMTTFLAHEWTSEIERFSEECPYGYYGHRNLILADPYFPRWWNSDRGMTPAELWDDLRKMKANFVTIPHQVADTGNLPTDWSFIDEKAQPVAEIFQIRGSYEYLGAPRGAMQAMEKKGWFMQDVWERGIVIGVIASPDHGGGVGKAAVFATDLTREGILDAIRARRTFATTASRLFLDVRVNGRMMGEKLPKSERGSPVEVKIDVRAPGDIDRIEVCRNNTFVFVNRPKERNVQLTYVDTSPLDGYAFYYVRVIQKNEEIAWSSPVFLGAK